MRYCQIYDFQVLGRITLRQYYLMSKALKLQQLDEERVIYMQAWLNNQVTATKKRGKRTAPYFRNFKEFFDYERAENLLLGKKRKENKEKNNLKTLLLKANTNKRG